MEKTKCPVCKKNNKSEICVRCGASLFPLITEHAVFSSGGFAHLDYDGENFNQFVSCRVALTNQRIVIYKIKPQADNPAFGLIKDLIGTIIKTPHISINLNEIEWIRRYSTQHLISTESALYCLFLHSFKQWDELFTPYKLADEK